MTRQFYRLTAYLGLSVMLTIGCETSAPMIGTPLKLDNSQGCVFDDDEDGICNEYEGAANNVDTDKDGTFDYLDTDSDNDGIEDSIELGNVDPGSKPVDSDDDGIADFRDTDSDNNGIDDTTEGGADTDRDGTVDSADSDNDGDGIVDLVEIGEDKANPLDNDGDKIPNYKDPDSDNDNISDRDEGGSIFIDTDGDHTPDYLDLDSDNDGVQDRVEAGDDDLDTPAPDTDEDAIEDYRDPDADNDGLADGLEDKNGDGIVDPGETSRLDDDSDDDGATDLIETIAGTDPGSSADNPQANGDFYFVMPYEAPAEPRQDTLEFRTSVQYGDIYFLIDRTTSMTDEHTALNTSIPNIISDLRCTDFATSCVLHTDCAEERVCFQGSCIQDPLLGDGCVPNLWTGAGAFGNCDDYVNMTSLQADAQTTADSIAGLSTGGSQEAVFQSATCVADPSYCASSATCGNNPSVTDPVGCPGFRPEAVRILVHVTDAGNQAATSCGGVGTASIVGNELDKEGIKYIGLYGTSDEGGSPCGNAQDCTTDIGNATDALDQFGNPFVYAALDAAVADATKQAVLGLVQGVPLRATIDAQDLSGDDGDALPFIAYLEVNVSGNGNCTNIGPVEDTNADGHDDTFEALVPGTFVCWDVHPVDENTTVPATAEPQVFRAELTVSGDGSPLDSRQVYFLVPPVVETGLPIVL